MFHKDACGDVTEAASLFCVYWPYFVLCYLFASSDSPLFFFCLSQIWDFDTGRPMEMRKNESCTASCMMTDGERMVLARTERFGSGVTVIIWDVLGNEPNRYLKYEPPTNVADHISYVGVSRDNRFVVAAYQVRIKN